MSQHLLIDDAGVRAAIDEIYRAFGDRRLAWPVWTDACADYDEAVNDALATPLRELSADAIDVVAIDGPYCYGTPEDFAYFFPRLLEAICGDFAPDVWPLFKALGKARLTQRELRALRGFFAAIERVEGASNELAGDAGECAELCGAA